MNRSLILSGVLALWMVGLLVRLYQLEIFDYVELLSRAQRQQQRTVEVAPERGAIYDRDMHPLAMSLAVESVYAVPADIANKELAVSLLAPVLDLDRNDLLGRLNAFKSFCWVKRKISSEEVERVLDLNLKGIYFQKEMKRFYPKGDLAAPVLGYVGLDDKGLAGLEYGFKEIAGKPGRVLLSEDARRQSFHSTEWEGQAGKNIVLTLDENIQFIAEKALAQTMEKFHAAGGVAIVENPNTGELLAMAGEPSFDPNNYADSPPMSRIDRPVAMVYEPGSVFKIVAMSAALEEKLTNPSEVIDCQMGSITIAGHVIHDDGMRFGRLTLAEVLAHSSDVGAIKLGLRLGDERFYEYMRKFGFGARTNIELPGEERGLLRPPRAWSAISIGALSIGQEVGVTPIQLISAYSAIANGGILIQPRLVRDIYRGTSHDVLPPAQGRRIVSEKTAAEMRQMFEGVIDHGTGTTAQVAGYTAGGKTGTAQKIDSTGHYSKSHHIASFVGFAPAEKPAIAILVTIDSPVGAMYGREVAAPAFASIASQTLSYLNIPQDNPSSVLQVASSASAGSLRQQRRSQVETRKKFSEIAEAALSPVQPVSYSHGPHSNSGTVLLNDAPLATVPDFSGMALRAVVADCEKLGFELKLSGSGVGQEQMPVAGAKVPPGSGVYVRFGR